jgi:uncharacterized protein YajQ (UPF0234 family)
MEVDNAVHQAQKELSQRFDFKGSKSSITYNKAEKKIILVGDDDFKLRSVKDILGGRMVKRGISLKSLNMKEPQGAFEGTLRQEIELTSGLPKEKSKELSKLIKEFHKKVQVQIEGDKLRVISPKKDDLQKVIAYLRGLDFSLPLQFTNYR